MSMAQTMQRQMRLILAIAALGLCTVVGSEELREDCGREWAGPIPEGLARITIRPVFNRGVSYGEEHGDSSRSLADAFRYNLVVERYHPERARGHRWKVVEIAGPPAPGVPVPVLVNPGKYRIHAGLGTLWWPFDCGGMDVVVAANEDRSALVSIDARRPRFMVTLTVREMVTQEPFRHTVIWPRDQYTDDATSLLDVHGGWHYANGSPAGWRTDGDGQLQFWAVTGHPLTMLVQDHRLSPHCRHLVHESVERRTITISSAEIAKGEAVKQRFIPPVQARFRLMRLVREEEDEPRVVRFSADAFADFLWEHRGPGRRRLQPVRPEWYLRPTCMEMNAFEVNEENQEWFAEPSPYEMFWYGKKLVDGGAYDLEQSAFEYRFLEPGRRYTLSGVLQEEITVRPDAMRVDHVVPVSFVCPRRGGAPVEGVIVVDGTYIEYGHPDTIPVAFRRQRADGPGAQGDPSQ